MSGPIHDPYALYRQYGGLDANARILQAIHDNGRLIAALAERVAELEAAVLAKKRTKKNAR